MSPKTGIVMLNMGGPATLDKVENFLTNLFTDPEIIPFPFGTQNYLGPMVAKRRTPSIVEQYRSIGGGSPIGKWTDLQGKAMCTLLDKLQPENAPHQHYIAFRYADPLTEEALTQMKNDGVTRAIAMSQYPQWSCTTTGSSMNHLWRELKRLDMGQCFKWSVIDKWNSHPGYIAAMAKRVEMGLELFEKEDRDKVVIMFSAHSVPMMTVNKGDPYVTQIAASSELVMKKLNVRNASAMAWQSKVGYLPWMGPSTSSVLKGLAKQGHKHVLAVPIAFTTDHVETLFEIDEEYATEALEAGMTHFKRAPAMNDEPLLAEAMADLVSTHMKTNELHSPSFPLNCPGCVNPDCRMIMNPIKPYSRLRDVAQGQCTQQQV